MPDKPSSAELFEYRIQFSHENEMGSSLSSRHFYAENLEQALELFDYASQKNQISPEIDSVEHWNRWANRWERDELPVHTPSHPPQDESLN